MDNGIKKGDYIRVNGGNTIYKVLDNINVIVYEEPVIYGGSCKKSDAVKVDKRTAFLTRLQSLLREFDAEIVFHCDYKQEMLATSIIVGESELRQNEIYGVTADNIMDFDKEGV